MTPAYPRCPAYLRNTSNSRRSTSRLCLSCSCGEKTGMRFLTVIVRSPRTAVFTSLLYLTCACIKSLPYDNRNRMLETPRASTAKVLALGRRHLWTKCPEVLRALGAPRSFSCSVIRQPYSAAALPHKGGGGLRPPRLLC